MVYATRTDESRAPTSRYAERDTDSAFRSPSHVFAHGFETQAGCGTFLHGAPWPLGSSYIHMAHDKKTMTGRINLVLVSDWGEPFVIDAASSEYLQANLDTLGAS